MDSLSSGSVNPDQVCTRTRVLWDLDVWKLERYQGSRELIKSVPTKFRLSTEKLSKKKEGVGPTIPTSTRHTPKT